MLRVIRSRNINFELSPGKKELDLMELQPQGPGIEQYRVRIDAESKLIWPVIILYFETDEAACIQSFHEDTLYALMLYKHFK